jgi:hypothetical protein
MTRFLKIIWCGRSMLLSICLGFAANLHLIVRRWVGHRAIRNNQYSRDAGVGIESVLDSPLEPVIGLAEARPGGGV